MRERRVSPAWHLPARRFKEFVEAGNGDFDFSAIYRSIRK